MGRRDSLFRNKDVFYWLMKEFRFWVSIELCDNENILWKKFVVVWIRLVKIVNIEIFIIKYFKDKGFFDIGLDVFLNEGGVLNFLGYYFEVIVIYMDFFVLLNEI